MLHEVCPEALLLRGYPGQRQADRQYHTGSGQVADVQLAGDSRQRQEIVILIQHFVGGKLLMALTDHIGLAVVGQDVAAEHRLISVNGHDAGSEAAVGGFHVAIAMVDADDNGLVFHVHHFNFLF